MTPDQNHSLARTSSLPGQVKSLVGTLSGKGAREGYLAAADQAVISASNFIATIILARVVSPTELGIYGVGFTALRLVRSLQEGLVIQPMNVYGASMDEKGFTGYATSTSLIQIFLALTTSALAALGGWLLTQWGNDTAGPALFALWFSFLWWQLQEYIRRMLYTRAAIFHALANTIIANVIRLLLLGWWASQAELSGIKGLHAIGWGSLAALLPGLWLTRKAWTSKPQNLIETWRRNWEFGRWIMGSSLANWLAVEFYPILTAGMISFAAAGAYRALQNLVAPVHLLLRALDTFLTPRAARQYEQYGWPVLGRTLKLIYLISGVPILGLLLFVVLFPSQLLGALYGETYLAYSHGVALMALFYALLFAYWPLQAAFKAARFSQPIFIANLAATLMMFSVGIWAILRWGVYGTIAGQGMNALVVNIILWTVWFSDKSRGLPPRNQSAY